MNKGLEGQQYVLLRVITAEDAEPPAEWDWSALADMHRPDAITVEWAGPFTDYPYEDDGDPQ